MGRPETTARAQRDARSPQAEGKEAGGQSARAGVMLSLERVVAFKDILSIKSGGCQRRNSPNLRPLASIPAENTLAMPARRKQGPSPQTQTLPSHPRCSQLPPQPVSLAQNPEDEDGQSGNKARTERPGSTFPAVPASARLPGDFCYKQPLREEFWRQWKPSPGSCRLLNH